MGVDRMADTESGIPGTSGSIDTSPSTATVVVSSSESIDSASEPESEQEDQSDKNHFVCQEII